MKLPRICMLAAVLFLLPQLTAAVTQDDVVGYWTFDLQPGFNLVSFPLLPENSTVGEVIGDALGGVEITTWDSRLGRYRWTRYDTEAGRWTGDMYVLDRGTAYWFHLPDGDGNRRLIITGHPEQYTRFEWSQYGTGWKYFAPTFGKPQMLADLPSGSSRDLLVSWNRNFARFDLAEGLQEGNWHTNDFLVVAADEAYIAFLNQRQPRQIGPTLPTAQFDPPRSARSIFEAGDADRQYRQPPQPLIVGNADGLPVCYANGGVCGGGFDVQVIRERLRLGPDGELESAPEIVFEYSISPGNAEGGKFKLALAYGEDDNILNPCDRVYLLALGPEGGQTRSTSFEVPDNGARFVPDVGFPEPMSLPGSTPRIPGDFSFGSPYPNPFNDRFQVEFRLPETSMVEYSLYDVRGRLVFTTAEPFSAGVHRKSITAGSLPAGLYILEISSDSHRGIAKVAHIK